MRPKIFFSIPHFFPSPFSISSYSLVYFLIKFIPLYHILSILKNSWLFLAGTLVPWPGKNQHFWKICTRKFWCVWIFGWSINGPKTRIDLLSNRSNAALVCVKHTTGRIPEGFWADTCGANQPEWKMTKITLCFLILHDQWSATSIYHLVSLIGSYSNSFSWKIEWE